MSDKNPIFNVAHHNILPSKHQYGVDINEVNHLLKQSIYPSTHICIICSNTADYRLIPKDDKLYTAEIQDKGYVCEYCLQQKYIDPTQYGIRPLKRSV